MERQRSNRFYLAVAFGLFALVAVAYGGVSWLTRRTPQQRPVLAATVASATPIVSASPVPRDVPVIPVPTIDPQPFPTPIINGSTRTPGPVVSWKVTKMIDPQFNRPYWMAPTDVVAQVRQDYQAIDNYHRQHIFDGSAEDLKQFFVEPLLHTIEESQRDEEAHGEARGEPNLVRPELQILGFSADGSEVQVAQEMHGETVPVYNRTTHQLIRVEHLPVGVTVATLVYDGSDQRWKMSDSRFVPGPPGLR
jgi:hypothetical protein